MPLLLKQNNSFAESHIWSDPQSTLTIVNKLLARLSYANETSHCIKLGSFNAEYLWQTKALHYMASYKEIGARHHLLALQEVSPTAISLIGSALQYKQFVSSSNNRGQSVGFLVHPRLMVINVIEHSQLTNIFNIPNLRPALQLDIFDPLSNTTFSVINVHLKSMIGGLPFTSMVRQIQLDNLTKALAKIENPTIVLGDFNCLLDLTQDISVLTSQSFILANTYDHTSTQNKGGRLDGLFYKNLPPYLAPRDYTISSFWRQNAAGRSLSDHSLLTWKLPCFMKTDLN